MSKKKKPPTDEMMSRVFSALGKKGGPARAKALSEERRKEIASKAAKKRWAKKKG
jgi:hypothetical protein